MYILGIDGGGTKTKFTLVQTDGTIIHELITPTIHYLQVGLEGLHDTLKAGLENVIHDSGISLNEIKGCFVGCPGYGNIAEDMQLIEASIARALADIPHAIGNDTDNALAGSLADDHGICVIAGTGSIGLGIDENGNRYTSGGWYYTFGGDEGSAAWIAQHYMQLFTKQSDGRLPRTELYEYMKQKHSFKEDSDLIQKFVIEHGDNRTIIAQLATDIGVLAKIGDPYAIALFEEAGIELASLVRSIYSNLNFEDTVRVSYAGGVFNSGVFILDPFKEALIDLNVEIVAPVFEPSLGSVILGFKTASISVTPQIIYNLKQSIAN